jgi:hypothetical protein
METDEVQMVLDTPGHTLEAIAGELEHLGTLEIAADEAPHAVGTSVIYNVEAVVDVGLVVTAAVSSETEGADPLGVGTTDVHANLDIPVTDLLAESIESSIRISRHGSNIG